MSLLQTLDDAISALRTLREQAASGQLDENQLQDFVETALRGGLLEHGLVRQAQAGSAPSTPSGGSGYGDDPTAGAPSGYGGYGDDPATTGDGAASSGADTPAEAGEGDDEQQLPPHHAAEQLARRLGELGTQLTGLGMVLPAQAAQFLTMAPKAADLPDDDDKGEKLAQVLFQGVLMTDQIEAGAAFSRHRQDAAGRIAALRMEIAGVLAASYGLTFGPAPDLTSIPGDPPAGVSVVTRITPDPDGTVLAVLSRSVTRGGKGGGTEKVLVSRGRPGELRTALIGAWQLLEEVGDAATRGDLDKLAKYVEELQDGDTVSETNTARHALNLLHENNGSGQLDKVEKWLLAFLGKLGIKALPIKAGKLFDDSYSPSKYDRHLEFKQGVPAGVITRVVRIGLVDKDGLTLQKCVAGVSKGG